MLPKNSMKWPPQEIAPVLSQIRIHDAWYSGDPQRLMSAYTSNPSLVSNTSKDKWPGAVPLLKQFFWGKQSQQLAAPGKLHIPIASDICTTSADLLFAEPPDFKFENNDKAQARLEEIGTDVLGVTLLEAAEISAALGGVYLKIDWDAQQFDKPIVSAVHPDNAWPTFKWGQLTAVTFFHELPTDTNIVYRYLQEYSKGRIEYALYEGKEDELGRIVPLTEHELTAELAEIVDANSGQDTPGDKMLAWYVPNMRPNRLIRGSFLGRSDLSGVEQNMDALDEVWTSWMRDIRLGKARIMAPEWMLHKSGAGQGLAFDSDQEVYAFLNSSPTGEAQITQSQFAIRVAEHSATATALTEQIIRTAGYSAQSFGLTGDVAATATEITSRERHSFITRGKKTRYWLPVIESMLEALLVVDKEIYSGKYEPGKPTVSFGDTVQEDQLKLAQTIQALATAEAISTYIKVKMAHPEWDEKDVLAEVQRIKDDTNTAVADPFALAGNDVVPVEPEEPTEADTQAT